MIECEFPPLQALNKLGDGSLRSAKEVDKANLGFGTKLVSSISPVPFLGPKTWLLTSATASPSFLAGAKAKASVVHSLRDGIPEIRKGEIVVLLAPSAQNDYEAARRLATAGEAKAVVVVNGFAKVSGHTCRSMSHQLIFLVERQEHLRKGNNGLLLEAIDVQFTSRRILDSLLSWQLVRNRCSQQGGARILHRRPSARARN